MRVSESVSALAEATSEDDSDEVIAAVTDPRELVTLKVAVPFVCVRDGVAVRLREFSIVRVHPVAERDSVCDSRDVGETVADLVAVSDALMDDDCVASVDTLSSDNVLDCDSESVDESETASVAVRLLDPTIVGVAFE